MTNQEAIDELIIVRNVYDGMREAYKPCVEAIDMAIHALESEWEEMIVICDNCGHAIHVKKVVGDVKSRSN